VYPELRFILNVLSGVQVFAQIK